MPRFDPHQVMDDGDDDEKKREELGIGTGRASGVSSQVSVAGGCATSCSSLFTLWTHLLELRHTAHCTLLCDAMGGTTLAMQHLGLPPADGRRVGGGRSHRTDAESRTDMGVFAGRSCTGRDTSSIAGHGAREGRQTKADGGGERVVDVWLFTDPCASACFLGHIFDRYFVPRIDLIC